jgi:hypothetical protein
MKEITYYNEGEIYKVSEPVRDSSVHAFFLGQRTDGHKEIVSNYYNLSFPTPRASLDFFSVKEDKSTGKKTVKYYYKSEWYCKQHGTTEWYDTKDLDVCPAIEKLVSVGVRENITELFFDIKDVPHMKEIATYYNLPAPLNEDEAFTTAEHNWNLHFLMTQDASLGKIKMGSVKFIDGVPTYFKYYKYVPR